MNIAILWTSLSGYLNSSMRELSSRPRVNLFVAHEARASDAPFSDEQFSWIENRFEYSRAPDYRRLRQSLEEFRPDLVLCSWHISAFQRAAFELRGRAARIACLDNQWIGNIRQQIAAATSVFHLRRYYDSAFVPGERQAVWARRMGFREDRIWRGLYSANLAAFSGPSPTAAPRVGFLFAGRLAAEKGITVLAEAYGLYSKSAECPLPLIVAGTGPLSRQLQLPGVTLKGFLQPCDLPELFARSACFVLPSLFEPWGVVIHEAAAAGLPIICTRTCGAAVHLVQDGYNGFLIEPSDPIGLANALTRFSQLDRGRKAAMGDASRLLALQFSPERWANTVIDRGSALREEVRKGTPQ